MVVDPHVASLLDPDVAAIVEASTDDFPAAGPAFAVAGCVMVITVTSRLPRPARGGSPVRPEELITPFGPARSGVVPWRVRPSTSQPGVYVVTAAAATTQPDFDRPVVEAFIQTQTRLRLNRERPTAEALIAHLARWRLPRETILYIGKAANLGARVGQYVVTPLGAARPHAGGWWLKALHLGDLQVHWAEVADPGDVESQMLEIFGARAAVPPRFPAADPVLPWANLEVVIAGARRRRAHGLTGTRA